MQYPNSVIRASGAARPSPAPRKPVPRPKPPAPPRRKPGRPQPQRPRRPAGPQPRPAPARPDRPGPVRPNPLQPGRFPDRTPGLPYRNPPKIPPIFRRLPWLAGAGALYYLVTKPGDPWDIGDTYGPWYLIQKCDPPPTDTTSELVAHRMFNQNGSGPLSSCYVNQAGFWDGVTINPGPPWVEASPGSTARTRNRVVIQFTGALAAPDRVHGYYTWYRRHTNAAGGIPGIDGAAFPGPDSLTPQPGNWKVDPQSAPAPLPEAEWAPWYSPFFPPWFAPGQVPHFITPQPVRFPATRPEPWSPEAPDVGPRPTPATTPNPQPVIPVPDIVPEIFPEVIWQPAPFTPVVIGSARGVRPQPRAQEKKVRRPPRATKERKVRMSPLMGFLWNSFNPITEGIDLIKVFYECLPWKLKVAEYRARGKQPTPTEKLQIVYENINSLDVGCAVTGYIAEQLEDMLYSIGSRQIAQANRNDNRPIGYEAGGTLTGGGGWVGPIT